MESKRKEMTVAQAALPTTPLPAVVSAEGEDYAVHIPNTNTHLMLIREQDFGKIPGTSKPSLLKAGAEKILWSYGITTKVEVESSIEKFDLEDPFFYYRVRCECYLGDRLVTVGYGSSNTRERQCGKSSAFDQANSRLKMARKRSLVDAALMVGQLSGAFAQDLENDDFIAQSAKLSTNLGPDDKLTAKQTKRIYALAGSNGYTQKQAKEMIQAAGFNSTTDVTQKDYDKVCELFQKGANE